ncbi:kinase-like protein [Gigaspora margarita]|uniref:Kinase-like protein n=1 Tax=Gigaspora margarita TaxID=4874 RepID=A0A8H4AL39_GIGMA|nr:kinase-like protein [Gigaspora margarita]
MKVYRNFAIEIISAILYYKYIEGSLITRLKKLQKVSNQNIIKFYGVTKDRDGCYNMVLQCANDGNLQEYLRSNFKRLQWTDKLYIAKEISLGLMFLHNNNIIHQNLHSKNILIHNGQPKISDFGLSKLINGSSITSYLNVHGISVYMEPQYLFNQNYNRDTKSDIYSFGVILWEISSGKPPFQSFVSRKPLAIEIFLGSREEPIEGSPPQYVKLYKQCWNKDPSNRPEIDFIYKTLNLLDNESKSLVENIDTFNLNNSTQDIVNKRKKAHRCFNECRYVKALELYEEILKNNQHKGGKAMANALYKNNTLISLNLYNNQLGLEGEEVLTDALCKNTTLASLNLGENKFRARKQELINKTIHPSRISYGSILNYSKFTIETPTELGFKL